MAKADIAVLLALCAAFFIAIGDVIQQRSTHEVTDEQLSPIELFTRLLRDKTWWVGSVAGGAGFGFQAAALGFGSVLLVQALLVTSLLFALPLSAYFAHRRISRSQWLWAVLLAASVAVIVTVGNPTEGHSRAGLELWIWVAAIMGPAMALCVIGARIWSGGQERSDPGNSRGKPAAAVLLALVSGSLWGLFAVLTKGVVGRFEHGIEAVLRSPELYAWALVAVAATMWQQSSFRAGSMAASLPTMTVAEPIVGSILGIFVLGETLRPGDAGWFLLIVAVAAMVFATAALARGEVTSKEAPATESVPG
jgi:drug/metabolite transporter (DMT)-like permease